MPKINYKLVAFLCLTSFLLISCATIFKGEHAQIRVNSAPAGASVFINGIDKGTTPQTMTLKRDQNYVLTFKKEGYKDVKVPVHKNFDAATTILGNLVSFFLVGIVVDVATGAAYSLEPADVQANMDKLKAKGIIPAIPEPHENEITVIMLTQKEWQAVNGE